MTHILEDSTHKIEGHPPKKGGHLGSRYTLEVQDHLIKIIVPNLGCNYNSLLENS